jgi:hypothetical protein
MVGEPGHVISALRAREFRGKETDVSQKLETQLLVTEQESQE